MTMRNEFQPDLLQLEVLHERALPSPRLQAIQDLCRRAYGEDLADYFAALTDGVHVLGFLDGILVSHAMWVTRGLQAGDGPLLHTAYVEMVATEPAYQGRGLGRAVMGRLAAEITAFDLGALCPAETSLYGHLGWIPWRGPLYIRTETGLLPTPEEAVMVLPTPRTPALDLELPLSAEWRAIELW